MEKRKLVLGSYDTARDGLWTLRSLKLTKPEQVQSYLSVPGRRAPLDASTYLTDGQPWYENRRLEAVLESSEGDRLEREERINTMVNHLDGFSMNIYLPDDPTHYLVGRVQVFPDYNDLAHCSVQVVAVCEPWRYATTEKVVQLTAGSTERTVELTNSGRLAVVPKLTVANNVRLVYGSSSISLSAGEHLWPSLYLTPGANFGSPGSHRLTYSGSGSITIAYREAVV